MNNKPSDNTTEKPAETPPAPPKKKNLSLDISDVSEVLERKISP
jgi:hypothetical protein